MASYEKVISVQSRWFQTSGIQGLSRTSDHQIPKLWRPSLVFKNSPGLETRGKCFQKLSRTCALASLTLCSNDKHIPAEDGWNQMTIVKLGHQVCSLIYF